MVVKVSLDGARLFFTDFDLVTFYGGVPDSLELQISHSDVWTHLKKQIVILNGNEELQISFENNNIVEVPKEFLKYPGIIIYCKGQNEVEKPTFYITSNYMVIGVDKYCKI
jgi:hypothetical protein